MLELLSPAAFVENLFAFISTASIFIRSQVLDSLYYQLVRVWYQHIY